MNEEPCIITGSKRVSQNKLQMNQYVGTAFCVTCRVVLARMLTPAEADTASSHPPDTVNMVLGPTTNCAVYTSQGVYWSTHCNSEKENINKAIDMWQ
jgi:hypothetical protein